MIINRKDLHDDATAGGAVPVPDSARWPNGLDDPAGSCAHCDEVARAEHGCFAHRQDWRARAQASEAALHAARWRTVGEERPAPGTWCLLQILRNPKSYWTGHLSEKDPDEFRSDAGARHQMQAYDLWMPIPIPVLPAKETP